MNFDQVFRSCNMEGFTIIFLLRRRTEFIFKEELGHFTQNPGRLYNNFSFKEENGHIFKEEPGHFTKNPGGFYNNFSFKKEEWAHFQGGTGPLYPEPIPPPKKKNYCRTLLGFG